MYVLIVGAGEIGRPLVEIATSDGNETVVVEQDERKAESIARDYDCLVLNADATSKDVLLDAGADRADAVVTTTDHDATNVMVCLLAQELGIPAVVSIVHDPEHMGLFRQLDVNTIENPQHLIAEYLFRAVERPTVVDFMRIGEEAEIFEVVVTEDAPIAGSSLRERADLLRDDLLVVAIERSGEAGPIPPRGNTRIQAGDLVTVYSARGITPDVTDAFGRGEDRSTVPDRFSL